MNKIPIAQPDLSGNELKYTSDCIKSSWISSMGSYIGKFEKRVSEFCGVKHGISTSNGTAALHLALKALGIKGEDEVIVPNLTFVSTANVVKFCNAKPILVDVDIKSWNIDVNKIEEKINKNTKAIIPVHLYGNPCRIDVITEIAKKHNLFVIEDCAEAIGAEYKKKKVGSFSDVSCFSFYGNKIITTGEGGMCLTNDKKIAEKINILKNHGVDERKKYWHPVIGFNYRMTNIQAAIGLAQLERIEGFIEIRRNNAKLYNSLLGEVNGITIPPEEENGKNVYWMYSVLLNNRTRVIEKLEKLGIETRPFFYPIGDMPPYKTDEKFPISSKLSREGINLPCFVNITKKQIDYICKNIKLISKNN